MTENAVYRFPGERQGWLSQKRNMGHPPANPLGDTTRPLSLLAKHPRFDDAAGLFDSDAFARETPQIPPHVADGRNFSRAVGFD